MRAAVAAPAGIAGRVRGLVAFAAPARRFTRLNPAAAARGLARRFTRRSSRSEGAIDVITALGRLSSRRLDHGTFEGEWVLYDVCWVLM